MNTFELMDVERILWIPLTKFPHEDVMVWSGEASSIFSIRNAYKPLQRGSPNFIQTTSMYYYKKLWNMDIPAKIKITIWWITNEFIPTRSNLFKQRIVRDAMCPLYGNGIEDLVYVFYLCPISQEVWELVGMRWINQNNIHDWVG